MNSRLLIIVLVATALGLGAAYQLLHSASRSPEQQSRPTAPEREVDRSKPDVHPKPLPSPKPPAARTDDNDRIEAAPATARVRSNQQPPDPSRYWEHQLNRFNELLEQFAREEDPSRRLALIRALAAYVRIDTLAALEWAMALQDPTEQRAALEAINKSALSGIGARIETDATGFPVIRETTVLSALATTGLVEPGDYIVGIVTPDGQHISFEQLSTRQVVEHLRGPSGSEVQLLIERLPSDGAGGHQTFPVSVQRSLLVVQPPY